MANPIPVPYLMMYSTENEGANEVQLSSASQAVDRIAPNETKHLIYHDITLIFRKFLRLVQAVGTANPEEIITLRKRRVLDFLKRH